MFQIRKFCVIRQPCQIHVADRAVSLFGDDDRCDPFLFTVVVVVVVTVNEHNDVRILLDRTGFTQVGKHRRMIRSLFYRTAQLRKCDNRHIQFPCEAFERTGDLGDLVLTGFRPSATAHELQVVNDDHFQIMLQFIFSTFAAELGNADTRCVVDD